MNPVYMSNYIIWDFEYKKHQFNTHIYFFFFFKCLQSAATLTFQEFAFNEVITMNIQHLTENK